MDKISAVGAAQLYEALASKQAAPAAEGFAEALSQALASVSEAQNEASRLAARFQMGDPAVSLEESMIALQKAGLGFQALVQVRNRLIAAYNDIMNMQV